MDTPSFLEQIRPRAYARYQALPLFGAVIADFSVWLSARGYRTKTIKSQLKGVRYVDRWLRRKGRRRLSDVTDMDMHMAHHRFRSDSNIGGPVRSLGQFLRERGFAHPAVGRGAADAGGLRGAEHRVGGGSAARGRVAPRAGT